MSSLLLKTSQKTTIRGGFFGSVIGMKRGRVMTLVLPRNGSFFSTLSMRMFDTRALFLSASTVPNRISRDTSASWRNVFICRKLPMQMLHAGAVPPASNVVSTAANPRHRLMDSSPSLDSFQLEPGLGLLHQLGTLLPHL